MTTLIISQDIDGCIYTSPLGGTVFEPTVLDKNPGNVKNNNKRYIIVLAHLIQAKKIDRVIFISGSAAQSFSDCGFFAWTKGTMGVFPGIQVIIEMLREELSAKDANVLVELSMVTMSDVTWSQPPEQGFAYSEGKKRGPIYDSKLSVVYLAAHYLVRKIRQEHPDEKIFFFHVDDKKEINQHLIKYLAPLLPKDMDFHVLTYPQWDIEDVNNDANFYKVTQEGHCASSHTSVTDVNPSATLKQLFHLFPSIIRMRAVAMHFPQLLALFKCIRQYNERLYEDGPSRPRYSSTLRSNYRLSLRSNYRLFRGLLPDQQSMRDALDRLDGIKTVCRRSI